MDEITGRIFDIQRFSVHDGPGIRTTFFLKGCPLACDWCHNPEGLAYKKQLQYIEEKCIGCGNCALVCEKRAYDIEHNNGTPNFATYDGHFECVEACSAKALAIYGEDITVEDVVKNAQKDAAFYGKEGGVSFSGGECTMQREFLVGALKACKAAGLSTAIDTSGYCEWSVFEEIIPYTDTFLFDIKAISPEVHMRGTKVLNEKIVSNFIKLNDKKNVKIWVRIPVIPQFNETIDEMTKIADFLRDRPCVEQVELMPYHILGKSKYEQIGLEYKAQDLKPVADMQKYIKIFLEKNIPLVLK